MPQPAAIAAELGAVSASRRQSAAGMETPLLFLLLALSATTSSRPRNILSHVRGHEADRYDLSQPPPRPTIAMLQGHPPPPVCPAAFLAEAASTGMISVGGFRRPGDDAPAVRATIAVAVNCSAAVFFPPGSYSFHTTVSLPGGLELRGSGLRAAEFITQPGALIHGPMEGPAFLIEHVEKIQLVDLSIQGQSTGVIVTDSALIRFTNVGIEAQFAGQGDEAPCAVNGTAEENGGCNVAFGS
eukprot:COSAG06_NODE_1799_length_8367_cov_3.030721_4_plen_242_part_00